MQVLRVVIFAPYLVLTWLCWCLYVRLGSEAWSNEVAPGLWVGGACTDSRSRWCAYRECQTVFRLIHISKTPKIFNAYQPGRPLPGGNTKICGLTACKYEVACLRALCARPWAVCHASRSHDGAAGDERSIDGAMRSMRRTSTRSLHSIQRMDAEAAVKDATPLLENEGVSK